MTVGARGPKPIPSSVLKARGTYRSDRAAANEAAPTGKPTLPSWVTDADARKEWRRLVRVLTQMGLIGAADQNLLVRYCLSWVRYRRVIQTLAANAAGEFAVYKDEKGAVKSVQVSALHAVARSLSEELGRAEAVLGMSPSARSRIDVSMPPAPASEPDGKGRFFNSGMRLAN